MSAMTRRPSINGMVRARPPLGRGLRAPQAKTKTRTAAAVDRALEGDGSPVRLGNVLHDRQPQAGTGEVPGVVRSPEPVEDARHVLGGNTGAAIANRHFAIRDRDID